MASIAGGMRRALARATSGKPLDVDEATVLLGARGDELAALCAAAARVRDAGLEAAGRPRSVTYSRKVFVPLTRLCRDRCHYCTFATVPHRLAAPYLSMDEVLQLVRDGAALGCKEALFTLGDRPEERWPEARRWLEEAGYDSTLAYVRACAVRVLEETGLLPHLNAGVLSWSELQQLKPVAPSMGMMLETTPGCRPTGAARTRSREYGCGCSRTPGGSACRSPAACSWGSARRCTSARRPSSRCARRTAGTVTCRR